MIFGAYGKLPLVGDFIRRGLPPLVIAGWDDWLQARLSETPPEWPHEAGGSWSFLIAPGVIGPEALVGVMTPSRDRIGRLFPFLIASEIKAACLEVYDVDEAWLGLAEQMVEALRYCDGGVEVLEQALKDLTPHGRSPERVSPFSVPDGASLWWRQSDLGQRHTVGGLPDREAFASMITLWNDGLGEPGDLKPGASTSPDLKGHHL